MHLISAVFHPLLMATYGCALFYWMLPEIYSPIPYKSIPMFIAVVFITTAVIPALSIAFLMFTKRVSNLDITRREERSLPFLTIGLFYGATTYMLYDKMNVPRPLLVMMIAVTALIMVIFLISIRFKMSVHSAGIWGVAGLFTAVAIRYLSVDMVGPLSLIFIAAGLTTMSRLALGRHTPNESWAGIILGYSLCFSAFWFFA